jgi:hypothetical protein
MLYHWVGLGSLVHVGWCLLLLWLGMRHDVTEVRVFDIHVRIGRRHEGGSSQALPELRGKLKLF